MNCLEITYPIEINDLKTYLSYGGTIYFVVLINKSTQDSKVFYTSLLPLKIKHLLDSSTGKKTINTKLFVFPERPEHMDQVFSSFLSQKQRQPITSYTELPTLQNLAKAGQIEEISFGVSGYGFDSLRPELCLLDSANEIYTYVKIKGVEYFHPLEMITGTHMVVSKMVNASVSVNGHEFFNQYEALSEEDKETLKIGDCLVITINKRIPNAKLFFHAANNLKMAILSLEFF